MADREITAITDGDVLGDYRLPGALYAAREALLPDSEHAWRQAMAARMVADLKAMDDDLPACERAA